GGPAGAGAGGATPPAPRRAGAGPGAEGPGGAAGGRPAEGGGDVPAGAGPEGRPGPRPGRLPEELRHLPPAGERGLRGGPGPAVGAEEQDARAAAAGHPRPVARGGPALPELPGDDEEGAEPDRAD